MLITSASESSSPEGLVTSTPLPDKIPQGIVENAPLTRLRTVVSPTSTATANLLGASSPRFQKIPIGSRLEVSPLSFKIARQIGELLHSDGVGKDGSIGCALIVDYGGEKSYGNSFRVSLTHTIQIGGHISQRMHCTNLSP